MNKSVTYKILEQHLIEGELISGKEIGIRIDQTLTQDATGTMAYLQFESLSIPKVKTSLSVSYVDHNTLQMGFENADDHKYLETMNSNFGIFYSKAGNGICHQVHLERFGCPGSTLLGSDSHTPTGGGLGMIAIGAGGLDVAVAMGGGLFYLTAPKVVNIYLKGKLRPGVVAKDIILKVLSILTTKGNVGWVAEYSGPGLKNLSVPERATITNMGAELGVTTSVFPSDHITKEFLNAQNRGKDWREISADKKAYYDTKIEIDLSKLEPMIACPHSPDNIKKVSEVGKMEVDQVAIGSCTNASYKDLMTVAKILKGKKINSKISVVVSPGSKQVFEMISKNGALTDIISSGARIMEPSCGFCIGAGQSPISQGISLRTNNRNFEGRSGTKSAQVFLVSPETAALSALAGHLVNPLKQTNKSIFSSIKTKKFLIDDSLIIPPQKKKNKIVRGPNIGNPPLTSTLQEKMKMLVGLKVKDKITTDHIMPAGTRLKFRSNIPKYAEFVFENIDADFPGISLKNKKKNIYTAIVAGESYGQGSSREHAAICPMYLGVRVVIAKSIERIHAANLINFGIIPLFFKKKKDYNKINKGQKFVLNNLKQIIKGKDSVWIEVSGQRIELLLSVSQRQREILLAGGLLNYTKERI